MKSARPWLFTVVFVTAISGGYTMSATPPDAGSSARTIIDFSREGEQRSWLIVNDGVMGGLSQSTMQLLDKGFAEFSGTLSLENNGGFASVRCAIRDSSLGEYDGLRIRVRGDGRTYQIRLRMTDTFDGVAYQYVFRTSEAEWTEVDCPFAEFTASFRGRFVADAGPVVPDDIRQIGFLIADKQPGQFKLQIASIHAYREGQSPIDSVEAQ